MNKKNVLPCAGGGGSQLSRSSVAFTMAEILLSLTIIGVVAAITLPSLTGNINERTWNTQRKALYARISQAISLMPALNGFAAVEEKATETFVSELGKVLKFNNVCDNDHFEDCGIVDKFNPIGTTLKINMPQNLYQLNGKFELTLVNGISYSTYNTNAVAFESQNGESVVAYYNPRCKTEYLNESGFIWGTQQFGYPQATMCANFIYDLNGKKGPNTVGKDIGFITVFNSIDSIVVAPMPNSAKDANNLTAAARWEKSSEICSSEDSNSRLPNIDELQAMYINKDLISLTIPNNYWSSSVFNSSRAWAFNTHLGYRLTYDKIASGFYVRCVKR